MLLALASASMAVAQTPKSGPSQYVGPGSCSSSSCHGSVQPRTHNRVPQNEDTLWVLQDKHSKAFSVLNAPESQLIARNLGLTSKPSEAAECLGCHALNVPQAKRAQSFDLTDGGSCESCHEI